jgi:hypothetical protein
VIAGLGALAQAAELLSDPAGYAERVAVSGSNSGEVSEVKTTQQAKPQ